MTDQARKTFRELLLKDVTTGVLGWYYISVATDEVFYGGFVIQARGEAEAWSLFHALGFYPLNMGASTSTIPIPADVVDKIPESQRWRRLSADEARKLGE